MDKYEPSPYVAQLIREREAEKARKNNPANLVDELETWGEIDRDAITCPFCGHEREEWWDVMGGGSELSDGEEIEVDCCECDRAFSVTLHVSYSFTTKPVEAEEDDGDGDGDEEAGE